MLAKDLEPGDFFTLSNEVFPFRVSKDKFSEDIVCSNLPNGLWMFYQEDEKVSKLFISSFEEYYDSFKKVGDFEKRFLADILGGIKDVQHFIKTFCLFFLEDPSKYRKFFLNDPYWAWTYAFWIDGPHDDTRTIVCADVELALNYAMLIDEGPHDETRKVCNQHPDASLLYKNNVESLV